MDLIPRRLQVAIVQELQLENVEQVDHQKQEDAEIEQFQNVEEEHWELQLQRKKEENITERLEFLYQKDHWKNSPVNLQSHNVVQHQKKKNVEDKFMFKSTKEKPLSEKPLWMHVIAEQNFPEDAKETFMQEDAPEDTTDVQEDVWEKHAAFVQDLNASPKIIQLLAKDQL